MTAMHAPPSPPWSTSPVLSTSDEERTYSVFLHLAGMLSLLDVSMIVSTIVVGILWAVRKNRSVFIDDHGREALNFQLSMLLYGFAGLALTAMTLGLGAPLYFLGLFVLWIVRLVAGVRGAMAAGRGQLYRYPVCVRFLPSRL